MKKIVLSLMSVMAAALAMAQVRVVTPNTELILKAEPGQELQIVYFGNRPWPGAKTPCPKNRH